MIYFKKVSINFDKHNKNKNKRKYKKLEVMKHITC